MRNILIVSLLFASANYSGLLAQKYRVEILQNDVVIDVIDEVVELEKKEFQIRITLTKQDGVFMNASFQKDYFKLKKNEEIPDYKWINLKAMAEVEFNSKKQLILDDDAFAYLFFDKKKDWHRFDKGIVKKGKKNIGTKTIHCIYNLENKELTKLESIENDIYLFFVAQDYRSKEKIPKELGRYKIQVKWN